MAMTKRKTIALLVVVLLALAIPVMVLSGLLKPLAVISYDPDTQTNCIDNNIYGGGGYPDVKTDSRKWGELFDDSGYWISWANDGTSESIAVQGKFSKPCPGNVNQFFDQPTKLRYAFSIKTSAVGSFGVMRQDDFPEGFIEIANDGPGNLVSRVIHIDGTTYEDSAGKVQGVIDGSILRVSLDAGYTPAFKGCCEWKTIASDEAQLKSGVPEVDWEAAIYQIGETARVRWKIPVVNIGDTPAYFLTVTNLNDGSAVGGWNQRSLSSETGVAEIPVTSGMFIAGRINRLRAEIYSQVFRAGMQDTATIDDVNKAPTVVSVTFNQKEFREGDQAIVTITAVPNVQTASPIAKYYVLAHIGGDKVFDGFSSSNRVSFIASRTGILTAEVSAIDQAGRSSAVARVQATVGNVIVDCEVYPDLPACGGGGPTNLGLLILAIALLVIGILLVVLNAALPFPQGVKLALFFVGVVLALVGGAILVLQVVTMIRAAFPFIIQAGIWVAL